MDHWPQRCLLRDAKGQRVLGMGMDDGHDIRPRRENRGMNEALEIKAGALVAYRLTLEVELDDVFGTHQLGSERAGNQKAVGIVRVADADMAVGIDHLLAGEDPIGDHKILDQSIKTVHCTHHTGRRGCQRKGVYRVMKTHGLLLERHTGNAEERRHDGRVAVDLPDTRWCSDGFEIACDNGERVRIAFTLDCCDREAISWVATTGSINSSDIRDLIIESVERRFGLISRLPKPIELLSDNGSRYTAGETRALARDIGLVPRTTPIESPQSNGMTEAFVKLFKRDY